MIVKRRVCGLSCFGLVLLASCASVIAPPAPDCDPVAQTGCSTGEKCSQVTLSAEPEPPLETRCVPAGTRGEFETCSLGDPGDMGFDDCEAGLICFGGVCLEICSANPDSCLDDATCQEGPGVFPDRPDTGLCLVQCDPLAQNCPEGAACFVTLADGDRICAEPNPGQLQGAACVFANDCAAGHGCLLVRSPTDSALTCAVFCDPEGGLPSCAEGPGGAFDCVRIVDFYDGADHFGTDLGFCVDLQIFPASR